jgi:hypothetical protein
MSLLWNLFGSRLGQYVVGVLVAWMLIFAIGYLLHGPTPGYPVLHVFAGFLLGMLSMYIAMRLEGSTQKNSHA